MARSSLEVRQQVGGMFSIEDMSRSTGERWYVDSGAAGAADSVGAGKDPDVPFKTLDFAIGQATANNGDIIYVMPGHAETITADSGVDIDVAGLKIIGLGWGGDRPTFTFDTAVTADFKLAAANTRVSNLLFLAGIDALTGPIEISAADCALIDCEYRDDGGNNYETTDVVLLLTAAHRCLIDGLRFVSDGGAGGTQIESVINLVSADECEIRNCFIMCDGAKGCIEDQTASKGLYIHDNHLESSHGNDICITLHADSTGEVSRNFCKILTDTQVTWITTATDVGLFENYGVNLDGETGKIIGTASV